MPTTDSSIGRPRFVILIGYNGAVSDVRTDDTKAHEVAVATVRKDGHITGRPVPMLATPDPELVERIFKMCDSPDTGTEVIRIPGA